MRFGTINVNGLIKRQNQVITFIKDNDLDVLLMQEVHLIGKEDIHKIEKEVSGIIYLNSQNPWAGTAILIRKNLQNLQINRIENDKIRLQNRLTHIQIITQETLNIINVYCPADHEDKDDFFQDLNNYLEIYQDEKIILAGDFNYVEKNDDRFPKLNKNDIKIRKRFKPQNYELIDPITDNIFTHKNARLDRFYISEMLERYMKNFKTFSVMADHKPVLIEIDIEGIKPWGKFYWKLNNQLLNDVFYKLEVENLMDNFEERKENLNILENWEQFKNEVQKISKSYSSMKARQRNITQKICKEMKQRDFNNETMQNINKKEKEIRNFINKGNLVRTKNEALNKIYDEGMEINRKEEIRKGNYKFIYQIRNNDDIIITDKEQIINEIHQFYQNLYDSQDIDENRINDYLKNFSPKILTQEDDELLKGYIAKEEIRKAIKELSQDKSPGGDGITAEFYQCFQNRLIPILQEVYNNIWLKGELTESMKNGIIQLIFKKKGSITELKCWRPISLLTIDYKILTKILANRFKSCIHDLVNPFQTSGVKGRDILDNILNLQNIIQYAKSKDLKIAFISLDNEKAFDRIEHNFIIKVLKKYKFPNYILKWIKTIYSNITSQVMVNGQLTPKIAIKRSVRQGCPLSMLLYILCLEPLISKIQSNTLIQGLRMPNGNQEIKSIQHADDMTVIVTKEMSYKILNNETKDFGDVSGSKINVDKTEILCLGNFEVNPKKYIKDTIKVLGCFFGKDEHKNFQNALEKMEKIIQNWKFLKVNIFERVGMLKTYVISILQYVMRAFSLPKNYVKKFNALLYPYIWNSKREKLARNIINQPVELGGLAMINIEIRNQANMLTNLRNIELKINQPWALLYVYWLGIQLREIYPDFAKNKWLHTLDIPISKESIKHIILKFQKDGKIWQISTKLLYSYIINTIKLPTRIERNNPTLNWHVIWKVVKDIKPWEAKTIIYKYLYGILPTGDMLKRYHIFRVIPKCNVCKKGLFTLDHVFINCEGFKRNRDKLLQDLKVFSPNVTLSKILIRYGNCGTSGSDFNDFQTAKIIFEYVDNIWESYYGK